MLIFQRIEAHSTEPFHGDGSRQIQFNEAQWAKIYQFLKQDERAYAGKEEDSRRFLEAVLWLARSGAPWRLLPGTYGNWNTHYKRFARWEKHGIWQRMLDFFADEPDQENLLIDSTIVRAHPCAAGALKNRKHRTEASSPT